MWVWYVLVMQVIFIAIAVYLLRRLEREDQRIRDEWLDMPSDMPDIYLELDEGVSVGVKYHRAWNMTEDEFYKMYREWMIWTDVTKSEARAWAQKQVAQREAALLMMEDEPKSMTTNVPGVLKTKMWEGDDPAA